MSATYRSESPNTDIAITCIFCGEPLDHGEIVKYQDWYCHNDCYQESLNEHIASFDKRYFWLAIIGAIIGVFAQIPLVVKSVTWDVSALAPPVLTYLSYNLDYTGPAIAYFGLFTGFLLISSGYKGFAKNYDDQVALIGVFLNVFLSIVFLGLSLILFVFGPDPTYFDNIENVYRYASMPSFMPLLILSRLLFGIDLAYTGILVWMLEREVNLGVMNRVLTVILVVASASVIDIPIFLPVFLVIMAFLFYVSGYPKYWFDVEPATLS